MGYRMRCIPTSDRTRILEPVGTLRTLRPRLDGFPASNPSILSYADSSSLQLSSEDSIRTSCLGMATVSFLPWTVARLALPGS